MVSTATAASTIDAEAFNRMVLEKHLPVWSTDGYVYTGFQGPKGWELYRVKSGPWGIGSLTHNTIAQPAVATNPATTTFAATGYETALEYVFVTLVCDANVATRLVYLQVDDGTNTIYIAPLFSATASQTVYATYAIGMPYDVSTTRKLMPLPDIKWSPGCRISFSSSSIQVGDQFSITRYGTRRMPSA